MVLWGQTRHKAKVGRVDEQGDPNGSMAETVQSVKSGGLKGIKPWLAWELSSIKEVWKEMKQSDKVAFCARVSTWEDQEHNELLGRKVYCGKCSEMLDIPPHPQFLHSLRIRFSISLLPTYMIWTEGPSQSALPFYEYSLTYKHHLKKRS